MTNQASNKGQNVVLVAHEQPNTEHLGIRLVAAALAEAGFRPVILPLRSPNELAPTVADTQSADPLLVGISISDPLVAPMMFAYARLLRHEGFRRHITVGGALATLERAGILGENPGIDSVVRHAGEVSITQLARALHAGDNLDDVAGLTTRNGDGPGNPQAFAPTRLRPLRPIEQPTIIGIPKAEIAASRGCAGQCAYCGVSALQRDLAFERQRLGLKNPHVRGNIRRSADDVADEVADLYHQRGVRIGHFVDDNLLGPDPHAAQEWLTEFERALSKRRVEKMAWRLMMEPRAITDEVADQLARLGFLSVLVGFESLTPRGLATLGRPGSPDGSLAALDRLYRRGIAPVINVLALRPGGNLADTRAEIAALDRVDRFAWDLIPLMVWPGTQLASDLAARDQLAGKGAGLTWRPAEPAAERFLFALNRLRVGGLAWLMRGPNVMEASFALRAAHRLGLAGASRECLERMDAHLARAQQERRQIFAQALDLAESPLTPTEFGQALESLAQMAAHRLAPYDDLFKSLLDQIQWPSERRNLTLPPSLRLASRWLAGTILMAMAAGCAPSALHGYGSDAAVDAAVLADGSLKPDGPSGSAKDTTQDQQVLQDRFSLADGMPTIQLPDVIGADVGDAVCDTRNLQNSVAAATKEDTCDITRTGVQPNYAVVLDSEGRATELLLMPAGAPALSGTARQAWLDSVGSSRWPCLAGQTVGFSCMGVLY